VAALPASAGGALPPGVETPRTGPATFYSPGPLGACLLPQPTLHAALNSADFRGSAACGERVRVTRGSRWVVVLITNHCPDCGRGHIDLSPAAFRRLAEPRLGRVRVSWRIVAPPVSGAIVFSFKDGSSRWWTAIQVRNHRTPVARLDVRRGGAWSRLPRSGWNHFVAQSGLGPGPYTLRVTDIFGRRLISRSVPLRPAGTVRGEGQFPAPPTTTPGA
jgi:expansin (peptidoglycan-binding protein)